MGIFSDALDWVAGVIDEDFLCGNEDAHCGAEAVDIKRAVGVFEAQQVERGQVAGGVVEEKVLGARVG